MVRQQIVRCSFIFLMLTFSFCKKEKTVNHPYIDFTFTGNNGLAPDTVDFKCNLGSPYVIQWDFGDGGSAIGQNVAHVYKHLGFFKVLAKIIEGDGEGAVSNNVNVSPYSKLRITGINGGVSAYKPDGTPWDAGPGINYPDMYFKIFDDKGNELTGTFGYNYVSNVLSTQYPINPNVYIFDFDKSFTVQFLDYDQGAIEDDLIGTYSFRPANNFRDSLNFPNVFIKTDAHTGATINVNTIWSY